MSAAPSWSAMAAATSASTAARPAAVAEIGRLGTPSRSGRLRLCLADHGSPILLVPHGPPCPRRLLFRLPGVAGLRRADCRDVARRQAEVPAEDDRRADARAWRLPGAGGGGGLLGHLV